MKQVANLLEIVAELSPSDRAIFNRLFHVTTSTGTLQSNPYFDQKLEKHFGSAVAAISQQVIKVTNLVTLDTALYNPLRALRPRPAPEGELEQLINTGRENDDFAAPLQETAPDSFGRVTGEHSLTASNFAKIDKWHSVVIFNEFHPLKFTAEQVVDYLMVARQWGELAAQADPEAAYFFFLWNCLWKSGASQVHGHAQATVTSGMHYGQVERLRRDALTYENDHRRNFFMDLVSLSNSLELTADPADRVMAVVSLAPIREREIWLITDSYEPELGIALHKTLSFYQSKGLTAFNVAIQMPPIRPVPENWAGFPVLVRIVSRGNPIYKNSDMGATDFFGANVMSSDPFEFAEEFRTFLRKH